MLHWVIIAAILVFSLALGTVVRAQSQTSVEIYSAGFINPKGMAFTDDGTLVVSESGPPGDVMVPLPVMFGGEGPIGWGSRISKVPPGGEREDFITGLPSIGLYGGIEMLGSTGLAVLDGELYEVAAGHMTVSPHLSRITSDGEMIPVADVGAFNNANPPPPTNGDAVPMGNPYDLVAMDGKLYITDGNYNSIIEATTDGDLSVLVQWPDSPVTVGADAGPDGNLYVAQFSPAPYLAGSGRIDRVTPDGDVTEGVVTDLTTPIDLAFGPDGTMYVLQFAAEFSAAELRYIPFGGEVRRVNEDGTTSPVVTNLVFPTMMIAGPDGALYVANYGNESNEGQGQILRVVPGDEPAAAPDVEVPEWEPHDTGDEPTSPRLVEDDREVALTIEIVEGQSADDWGYDPPSATIETGQAVEFINTGEIGHDATAYDGSFGTGTLESGQATLVVFDEPGEFDYYCQPHPWMQAVIVVEGEAVEREVEEPATFDELVPPSVETWQVTAFIAVLFAAVFGLGHITRRGEPSRRRTENGDDAP
jgi:plastocyanin